MVAELVRAQESHDVLVFDGAESFFDLGDSSFTMKRDLIDAAFFCLLNRKKYDIFHLHMVPAIFLGSILGRRAVTHIHSHFNERWKNPLYRMLLGFALRRSRATIAVSQSAARSIRQHFGDIPGLQVLENFCVDLRGESAKRLIRNPGRRTLLMVASMEKPKRQDIAIEALAKLPDHYDLLLAGTGRGEDQLRRLSENLGLRDRVKFLGAVKDVAVLYRAADICLLLSEWEGFGLVVAEAAQFGVPTVVNNIEGLRRSSPDPKFIVSDLNADSVARKILDVEALKNVDEIKRLLDEHWKRHSVGAYIGRLEAIYRSQARNNDASASLDSRN